MTHSAVATSFARRRRRAFLGLGLALAAVVGSVVATGPAVRAATPELILGRPGAGEYQPVIGDGWLAWQQNTRQRPGHYDVFARLLVGGSRVKVNRAGTNGANGSIDDGVLAFQEFGKGRSDIRLYDLAEGTYGAPPRRVNTPRWEFWPSISDGRLLFGRILGNGSREILLADLGTGEIRRLDRTWTRGVFLAPGEVQGEWAVWHKCPQDDRCAVVRYHIPDRSRRVLKQPAGSQYAPSVDIDGTVYYARSEGPCGKRVRIVRHPLVGQVEELWRLPSGNDVGSTAVSVTEDSSSTLLYDHFTCGRAAQADGWWIPDADPIVLTVTKAGTGNGVVSSSPLGVDCGSDCSEDFIGGTVVTLTASAATGSTFEGWSGACTGTGTCQVTMIRSWFVTATFTNPNAQPGGPGPTGPGPTGPTTTGPTGPLPTGPSGP